MAFLATSVADFSALIDSVAFGTASADAQPAAGTVSQLDVTSPLSSSALHAASDVTLLGNGVYTMFMMGSSTATGGVLRRDR